MHPFDFHRATDSTNAVTSGSRDGAKFIAGGTNLIDLMKAGVETPAHLVDVNPLPLATVEAVPGGIRIGALARMSDVAANALVKQHAPVISQALLLSASPQLRNMASIGGKPLQTPPLPPLPPLLFPPRNKPQPPTRCPGPARHQRRHPGP